MHVSGDFAVGSFSSYEYSGLNKTLQSSRPGLCGCGAHRLACLALLCWQSARCCLHSPVLLTFPPLDPTRGSCPCHCCDSEVMWSRGLWFFLLESGWAAAQSRHQWAEGLDSVLGEFPNFQDRLREGSSLWVPAPNPAFITVIHL